MGNKRYNKRISFHVDAAAKINNIIYKGELYDISLKGALIKIEKNVEPPINSISTVILTLPNSIITLEFKAKIAHKKDHFFGFKFEGTDVDSLTHLRRLLVLNTGDEEGMDKELISWLHNK